MPRQFETCPCRGAKFQYHAQSPVLFVFFVTFAVRTSQYFERLEQARPQFPVLSGGLFEYHAEEPTLLCSGLRQEIFRSQAR
jgi:hypothetical protein